MFKSSQAIKHASSEPSSRPAPDESRQIRAHPLKPLWSTTSIFGWTLSIRHNFFKEFSHSPKARIQTETGAWLLVMKCLQRLYLSLLGMHGADYQREGIAPYLQGQPFRFREVLISPSYPCKSAIQCRPIAWCSESVRCRKIGLNTIFKSDRRCDLRPCCPHPSIAF